MNDNKGFERFVNWCVALLVFVLLLVGIGYCSFAFGQTTTLTLNTTTKVTQPPVGVLTLDGASGFKITRGTGTPEGTVSAPPGSLYLDQNGLLWIKNTGVAAAGWLQVGTGGGAVASVFGRTGAVVAQSGDYASFYAPLGSQLPTGGTAGQLLQKNSATNYDAGWVTYTSSTEGAWIYKNVTTMADPSSGNMRLNNLTMASATQIAYSSTGSSGADRSNVLKSLQVGDQLTIQDKTAAANWIRFDVTSLPVNNTTWFQIGIASVTGSGTAPSNNDEMITQFGAGGTAGGVVDSVFGRVGAVTAQVGDYSSFYAPLAAALPAGGTTGQALTKVDGTNYNTTWTTLGGGTGTVTSITATAPIVVTPSPLTSTGVISITGYNNTNWDTAFTERRQWDGGSTNLVAATGRSSLGGTTVGQNFFTLTNPSAITFPKITAANAVVAEDATTFRTSIGAGTGNGTVTNFSAGDLSPLFTTTEATTTTTPALTFSLSNAAANTVFGNNTGSSAAPGFQTLVDAQVPNTLTLTAASNLTTNGFVKTGGGIGTLSVDTSTYLTSNQTITLSGAVTGSGTTAITTTYTAVPTSVGGAPTGGTVGQVLKKNSSTNYDYSWAADNTGGGGSPPGGSGTQLQFRVDASTFGGVAASAYDGTFLSLTANNIIFIDGAAPSSSFFFNPSAIPDSTQEGIVIPNHATPVIVAPSTATSNQWLTHIDTAGVQQKSVVNFNNLAGSATDGQVADSLSLTNISNLTSNGLIKTTGGTGALSIATADTDYTANSFKNVAVSGQSTVVADSAADTLNFANGANVTITTNATTDTITIAATGGGGGTPGGSDQQLQYNNAGAFGGIPELTYTGSLVIQKAGSAYSLRDPTDTTKRISIDGSGITTGNTRTFVMRDADGSTVPAGGSSGQVLKKNSATAYDYDWAAEAGGGAPTNAGYITKTVDGTLTSEFALGSLATGLLKNTAITGVPTIAVAGTDYEAALGNPGSDGFVLSSTTAGVRSWIAMTGGSGSPGGSDTQVQFNDGGAFGGSAGLIYDKTNNRLWSDKGYYLGSSGGSTGFGFTDYFDSAIIIVANGQNAVMVQDSQFVLQSDSGFAWSNSTSDPAAGTDLKLARNASGIAEINNGTAGQYRDLKARNINLSTPTNTAGDVATIDATQTLTNKRVTPRIGTVASSSSLTIDSNVTDQYTVTALAAAMTINAPSGTPTEGQKLTIRIKDNGTSRALTWTEGSAGAFRFSSDLAKPATTTAGKTIYLGFIYNSTDSRWDCVAKLDNFT